MKKAVSIKYCKNIDVPIIMAKSDEKIIMKANDDFNVEVMDNVKRESMINENAWEGLGKIFSFIISEQ